MNEFQSYNCEADRMISVDYDEKKSIESDFIDRVHFYGGTRQLKFKLMLFRQFAAQYITIKPPFVTDDGIYNQRHARQKYLRITHLQPVQSPVHRILVLHLAKSIWLFGKIKGGQYGQAHFLN